jgi:hypothetical protein
MALYTPHLASATSATTSTTRETILHAPTRASELITDTTDTILTNLLDKDCLSGRDPAGMSPWRVYFAYRTLGVHMRTLRESNGADRPVILLTRVKINHNGEPEETAEEVPLEEAIRIMKDAFILVAERWRVGGMFYPLFVDTLIECSLGL